MSKYRRISLLVAALAFVLGIVLAQAVPAANWPSLSAEDAKKIMPVSEVKRGMRGYGLTVFHGTQIEKFDVEILGVLKHMNTGRDLIMVRVGGGPINTRSTGIIGGMSGSPIYVNGKLLGAISYGAQFAKEPVGMVTPIADMLEAWDPNLPKHASGYSSQESLPSPIEISGKRMDKVELDPAGKSPSERDDSTIYMQPLMTTMMCSGISQRGLDRLADILRPFNIRPMAGPGGASDHDSTIKASLEPGAAVGMSLASGDIDMTGIGTVTYRSGNRIAAFGHPMLGIGAIDAPMTTAYITDVLSSYQVSTKLGSSLKTVGRIFQDRPWSIAGAIGVSPKTIPVTISVDDQGFKRDRVYHVNVINHPLLASRLIAMITDEAIANLHPTPGDATAMVSYDVTADQVGKISRSNIYFDPSAVDMPATTDIAQLLNLLSTNRFQPLDIKSVNVKVKILDKRDTATIDRIFVKKGEYEPGETVDVGVVLRPYKQARVTKTYQIKIPATAADGKVSLLVRGGGTPVGLMLPMAAAAAASSDSPDGGDLSAAALLGGDTGMATADNVNQLVTKFLEHEKNNEVVLQLQMRNTAINVAGEKLGGMPSSIADVMKSSRNSGLKMEREEIKAVYPSDSIISGMARLSIDVKRKSLKETKPAKPASIMDSIDTSTDPSLSSSGADSMGLDSSGDYGDGFIAKGSGTIDLKSAPKAKDQPVKEQPMTVEKDTTATTDDSADTSADSTADTSTPDTTPAPAAKSTTNVKTVVRQATTWTQKAQADFAKGKFMGVSASSENKLELAPTLKKLAETPEQYVWSVTAGKDGVYAGTGNSGKIYKINDAGESKVFYDTGELEVNAIAHDTSGNIYAGTSPHGKIFKISPDGNGKVLYATDNKYVLALAFDPEGNLYAGVGDAGKVYKITPEGVATLFVNTSEQQVLSLAWDAHGSLLIGTGINGVVYRVDRMGRVKPIFNATEDSATSVVSDGDGNAYVGTKSAIYKVSADGQSKAVYPKASHVMSMVCDSHNNVYAVSDSTLVKIAPDETVVQLDSSQEKVQFLSLALNEEASEIYASTGNVGSVYVSKCCDVKGVYESPVHDAKIPSKWGRIKWIADVPQGTNVQLRTRTGNVENPDSTWSNWSDAYIDPSGAAITSAKGRYIQYQVTLRTIKPDVTPRVSSVTVSYLTPNQPPKVKLAAPTGGETWGSKQTIKWTGTDPDKDTLTYDVYYSKDGGKTWKSLVGGMTGKADAPKKSASEITSKINSELAKSKEVPDEMKKSIAAAISGPDASKMTSDTKPAGSASTSTSYNWDTTTIEDGSYIVKVVVSDKTSNATDAQTDTAISDPFTVSNKGPEVKLDAKTVQMKAATSATITGSATGKVEIAGVQYRVDGGAWAAAAANSGMFDSPSEAFTVTTPNLAAGSHKVEVQAIDAAGNAGSATADVKVK